MKLNVSKHQKLMYSVEIETFDMKEDSVFFIGRNEDCHVVLNDKRISRYHIKIFIKDGQVWARNISQEGSLRINGVDEGEDKSLTDGDRISIFEWSVVLSDLNTFDKRFFQTDVSSVKAGLEGDFDPAPMNQAFDDSVFKNMDTESESNDEKTRLTSVLKTDIFSEDELNLVHDDLPSKNKLESESNEFISESNNEDDFKENTFSQDATDIEKEIYGSDDEEDNNFYSEEENNFDQNENDNFENNEFGENQNDEDGFGFNDFGGSDGYGDDEATNIIQSFLKIELFLKGPHAPVDRYVLSDKETFLGRDEDCQIILNDELVSEKHAVFKKVHNFLVIEDLDSSNGTYVDKFRINKQELRGNEIIEIGSTTITLKFTSEMLKNEQSTLLPVDEEQIEEREEIIEEFIDEEEGGEGKQSLKGKILAVWRDPQKRKPLLYAMVILVIAMLFMEEEETTETTTVVQKEEKVKGVKDNKDNKDTEFDVKKLSKEELAKLDSIYLLGVSRFEEQEYYDALKEFQKAVDFLKQKNMKPEYQQLPAYMKRTEVAIKQLKDAEEKRRREEELAKMQLKLAGLIKQAKDALKEENLDLAESFVNKVLEEDPENLEAQNIKLQITGKRKKIAEEESRKQKLKDERQRMIDLLKPGKNYFLKEKWYEAIVKLEEFLDLKGMDEDLIKEASDMIAKAKVNLEKVIGPLLSKAKSYLDGQDLKMAYETYNEVLKYNPNQIEALNKINEIFEKLEKRSKRIYREALVSESLSLFEEAKEKFEEVRQISPTGSNYYNKATNKLKNYLE